MTAAAIVVDGVSHRYGERQALQEVSFEVASGEIFGLLGPNGGGKTTLFRLLSTLLSIQSGSAQVAGFDVQSSQGEVRQRIGVTFQSPSLDRKLTVLENLRHQGHLYGLSGGVLNRQIDLVLEHLGLGDRRRDLVQTLSGGLQRRVEIAKSLLHEPQLLLLDEPSTGLDPGARLDLWQYLCTLRDQQGMTVLLTTHLMDEAERCQQLALLDRGALKARGTPAELRGSLGGDTLCLSAKQPTVLASQLQEKLGVSARLVGGELRLEVPPGSDLVNRILGDFRSEITHLSLGQPTLEDVFVQRTGHRFWDAPE